MKTEYKLTFETEEDYVIAVNAICNGVADCEACPIMEACPVGEKDFAPMLEKDRRKTRDRNLAQLSAEMFRGSMPGRRFRHFKGAIYVVDGIGVHSETAELMAIYHSEAEPYKTWCRPLMMFLSPVDIVKYPDAKQEMRFKLIEEGDEG